MIKKDKNISQEKFLAYLLCTVSSGCGFITQSLISGFWSAAYSHDIWFFSIHISIYLLGLGIGSLASTLISHSSFSLLIVLTSLIVSITGSSIPLLKILIQFHFPSSFFPIGILFFSAILVGIVLPLAIKLLRTISPLEENSKSLSFILFLDYCAAFLFTSCFTYFLLIPLGYAKTGVLVFLFSMTFILLSQTRKRKLNPSQISLCLVLIFLPLFLYSFSQSLPQQIQNDEEKIVKVLVNEQSHYQKIVLTEEIGTGAFFPNQPQYVLYLDGFVQFSSLDEQSYHACLVNIPNAAASIANHPIREVLILGGGDGLAARNSLTSPGVKKISLVEIDPKMIELSLFHPIFRMQNMNSLRSPRVEIYAEDAFQWVRNNQNKKYDVVIIDFPHPKNLSLSRLYTAEFYYSVFKLVKPNGFVSIQAGPSRNLTANSPSPISKIPLIIRDTVRSVNSNAQIYISPRDEEAFVLATPNPHFSFSHFFLKIGMHKRDSFGLLCFFDPTWEKTFATEYSPPVINTLNTLSLADEMMSWYLLAGSSFFNYRGNHAIFLPE